MDAMPGHCIKRKVLVQSRKLIPEEEDLGSDRFTRILQKSKASGKITKYCGYCSRR
jgi:hypothetical protein